MRRAMMALTEGGTRYPEDSLLMDCRAYTLHDLEALAQRRATWNKLIHRLLCADTAYVTTGSYGSIMPSIHTKSICTVVFNGKQVGWKYDVKHLGNAISSDLSDTSDCVLKKAQFISSANMMLGNYINVQVTMSFIQHTCYGSELWGCSSSGFTRNNTEWNKAAGRVLQVPICTHRWMLGPLCGQSHITDRLHCKIVRFIYHVIKHTNPIVNNMIGNHALACATSRMGANVEFLRFRYGVEFDNRLNDQFDYIKIYHQLDDNQCQI